MTRWFARRAPGPLAVVLLLLAGGATCAADEPAGALPAALNLPEPAVVKVRASREAVPEPSSVRVSASRSGVPLEVVSKVIFRHANITTTQLYLGKITDTEAHHWIDTLYS